MNLEYHPLIPQLLNRFSGAIDSWHSPRPNQHQPLRFGDATFRAEIGAEGTPYFSRVVHYPGGRSSGVTIGAGFDMGLRSRAQVIADLTKAGVPYFDAVDLARGAGLRGESARRFVLNNRSELPTISIDAQRSLFEDVVTPEIISDIKRILGKNDLVESYGEVRWDQLSRVEQELLFDLRYRGDYTPTTRKVLQPILVARDHDGLLSLMADREYWRSLGVPAGRIEQRIKIAEGVRSLVPK